VEGGRERRRRRSVSLTAAALLVLATLAAAAAAFSAPKWRRPALLAGRLPGLPGFSERASLSGRHFFSPPTTPPKTELLDPGYWKRQAFIAETLNQLLPNAPSMYNMKTLEIEGDTKYLLFFRPDSKKWNVDMHYAVSLNWDDKEKKDGVYRMAKQLLAKPFFIDWEPPERIPVVASSIDMAWLADGTAADLAKKGLLEAALKNFRRMLKKKGRLYLVMNEDDERAFQGVIKEGLKGSLLEAAGFELIAARLDEEGKVIVGYAQRKGLKAPEKRTKGFSSRPTTAKLTDALGLDDDDE